MKCNKNIVYEEIGKKITQNSDGSALKVEYSDEINLSQKISFEIKGVGAKISGISSFFLDYLNAFNIPSGFKINDGTGFYLHNHLRFPFMIRILNMIDERTSCIFTKKEGEFLSLPVYEFHYGNNFISESHIFAFDLCSMEDLKIIKRVCSKLNVVLKSYFERRNSFLAELKCTFGKNDDKIFLVDDFTPAGMRIIGEHGKVNPFKIKSAENYREYTDFIYSLINIKES